MTIAIIVLVVVGVVLLVGGIIWFGSWALDKTIKEYLDYARKGKGDGSE